MDFGLVKEPWIRLLRADGGTETLSLLETLEHAQEYVGLAGELPTQDMAVLRLLLAVLHAALARYTPDGAPAAEPDGDDEREDHALALWEELWQAGRLPMACLGRYLQEYEDRFWLFHEERPFWQVAELKVGTEYGAAKLNGELSESGHKVRLFSSRFGDAKQRLTYGDAARWLIYLNAFDDTSAKPKQKGAPSPGAGWLGQLGLIMAAGENLFQTLLLNLVLLRDGQMPWGTEKPTWEAERARAAERIEIPWPDNPSQLLTLQSRRLRLVREGDAVTGYLLLGGDFFTKENCFAEQMTLWFNAETKKDAPPLFKPRRHSAARQIWRDFAAIAANISGQHRPGVVSWLARLKEEHLLPAGCLQFRIASVGYGDKDFFVSDVFGDTLSVSANLLAGYHTAWVTRITGEIAKTEQLVWAVGSLARDLAKAAGSPDGKSAAETAKTRAYALLDAPLRAWLAGIEPETDDMDKQCDAWQAKETALIRTLGDTLAQQAGPQAFAGRVENDGKKGTLYSAPKAYSSFQYNIRKALLQKG
jgi:CRISPR system Cascade subunit CasA